MSETPRLRIGTRGSPLALFQAEEVQRRLGESDPELAAPGAVEIVVVRTTGDKVQDRRLAEIGGKGLFTKEIDLALFDGSVDIAVHSMKDVETWFDNRLDIPCMLPREDPRDVFLSVSGDGPWDLPAGSTVGTASLRRQAQILHRRPDLKVAPMRGNVDTRLRKLADGEADATLLALAGLKRLGMADRATAVLEPHEFLPAVGQGAIGALCRKDYEPALTGLAALNDTPTKICVTAERAMLAALDGSCQTPIGGLATIDNDGELSLRGLVARPDGTALWETTRRGAADDAERLGTDAGAELRGRADAALFD
jgi:hydroxymethylbilane synthase